MSHSYESIWSDLIESSVSSLPSNHEKWCLYLKLALKLDLKWNSERISTYSFSCLESLDLPLMEIVQLSVPFLREIKDYDLLHKYTAFIWKQFIHRREELSYDSNDSHPFSRLCISIPQLLPFILTSSVRYVYRNDDQYLLYKELVPFYIFIASSSWSSAFSKDGQEIIENFLLLPGTKETAKLLLLSLGKIKTKDYGSLAIFNVALERISNILTLYPADDVTTLNFLNILFCFANSFNLNFIDLLIYYQAPLLISRIKGFISFLLPLMTLVLDSSKLTQAKVFKTIDNIKESNPLINLGKNIAGKEFISSEIDQVDLLDKSLISSITCPELRYICLVYNGFVEKSISFIFVKEANSFLRKIQFYCLCSCLANCDAINSVHLDEMAEFLLDESCEDVEFGLKIIVELLKGCSAETLIPILRTILKISTKDSYTQNWAIQIFTLLNQSHKIRLEIADFMSKYLKEYPFLFPFIQASLSRMLKSSQSRARQTLFAICLRRIVESDTRQNILNFTFACSTQFFALSKIFELFEPACALVLNTMCHLASLKYVDPRSIWKNVVDLSILPSPVLSKNPEAIGNCILIASQIISCHKINVEEPIPEDILKFLEWIVTNSVKFKNDFVWDCAGKGFISFDYLYYGQHIPSSTEIFNYMSKVKADADNSIFRFLRILLDREISSMPRSMFLGNSSTAIKKESQTNKVVDNELIEKNLKICSTQWKVTPYFFESFLVQSFLACNVNEQFLDQLNLLCLLNMPSTMQMHWKSRLDLLDNIMVYVTQTLMHLNDTGKQSEVTKEFLQTANKMIVDAITPTNIANGLLLITAYELAQAEITKNNLKIISLVEELIAIGFPEAGSNSTGRIALGRFSDNEEILGSILLALNAFNKKFNSSYLVQKVSAVLTKLAARIETGKDVWLGVTYANLQRQVNPACTSLIAPSINSVFQSIATNESLSENKVIQLTDSLMEKGIDSTSIMEAISLAIVSTNNPSSKLLEPLRDLHAKSNIAEPSDLKSMISIHISKMASKCNHDDVDVWLSYLISRLEKPGPAVIKADAAIALRVLLFEDKKSTLASKASNFFTKSLPVLLSSTTDMRLLSSFVILMADYQSFVHRGSHATNSQKIIDANRFGKDSGFGVVLDFIMADKLVDHCLRLLASLKSLPRLDWNVVLTKHVQQYPLEILSLVAAHAYSTLASGGQYVSPSLSALFKNQILGLQSSELDKHLWVTADKWLPMFGTSEQYELLITCLESTKETLLSLETVEKVLPSLEVNDQERKLRLALQILSGLPDPVDSKEWRPVYERASKILSSLISLEELEDSKKINLVRLLSIRSTNGYDSKQFIKILRTFDYHALLYVMALELNTGMLTEELKMKFLSSLLELFMIEAKLHDLIPRLIALYVCNWPAPIFKDLLFTEPSLRSYFVDQHIPSSPQSVDLVFVEICWDSIDKSKMEDEYHRLQRRLIQILQEQAEFGQLDSYAADLFELLL